MHRSGSNATELVWKLAHVNPVRSGAPVPVVLTTDKDNTAVTFNALSNVMSLGDAPPGGCMLPSDAPSFRDRLPILICAPTSHYAVSTAWRAQQRGICAIFQR